MYAVTLPAPHPPYRVGALVPYYAPHPPYRVGALVPYYARFSTAKPMNAMDLEG